MLLSDRQAQLLRRGTVVVFAASFIIALIGVYGYSFDTSSQSLVKKSLVIFDSTVSPYVVSVNGLAQTGVDRELRLVPGSYEVSLASALFPGSAVEWKKKIELKEDELIRLGQPWLLPVQSLVAVDENLIFEKNWTVLMNTQYWMAYKTENKAFTVRLYDRTRNVETRFSIKGYAPKTIFTELAYDSTNELLYVLSSDHKITIIDVENLVVSDKKITARDLTQFENTVVYVSDKGILTVPDQGSTAFNGVELKAPYELESIDSIEANGNNLAVSMRANAVSAADELAPRSLVPLVGLLNSNGQWEFITEGTLAHFANEEVVYRAEDSFVAYNIASRKTESQKAEPVFDQAVFMRQVGKTFWRIFVTQSNHVMTCDRWGDNCLDFGTITGTQLMSLNDGFYWNFITQQKDGSHEIHSLDFDPLNKHEKTLSGILTNLIQGTENSLTNATSSTATEGQEKEIR